MSTYFNLDELTPIIKDFYLITNIRITVFDTSFQEVTSYVPMKAPLCTYLREKKDFDNRCKECDKVHMLLASKMDSPYLYSCHIGLKEIIAPLKVNDQIMGYVFFSHILSGENREEAENNILANLKNEKCVDLEKVKKDLDAMPFFTEEYLKAASRLLMETACYLISSRIVYFQSEDISGKIDDYINKNISGDLSSKRLCATFGIGKTFLYQITGQLYQEPLAKHIRKLRVQKAIELMEEDSDKKISAIATSVGFNDYYSFLSSFREETGKNPHAYYAAIKEKQRKASDPRKDS